MIQRSKLGLKFFSPAFSTPCLSSGPVNRSERDILQSRYLRRRVAHKQLARTSLSERGQVSFQSQYSVKNTKWRKEMHRKKRWRFAITSAN